MFVDLFEQFNLGWKLSLVCKSLAHPSLLDSYNAERLPVVQAMLQRTTAILEKTVTYKAGGADTSFINRPKALHQLGVNYRWSPIVVDEQPLSENEEVTAAYRPEDHTVLHAGDRAPDSPALKVVHSIKDLDSTATTTSLFSIFKPTRHTVLFFVSDIGEASAALRALEAAPAGTIYTVVVLPKDHIDDAGIQPAQVDLVVVDHEGHAYTYYPPAVKGFKTIIIRPDGVVGAVVQSVAGVEKYLRSVFVTSGNPSN